jgi:hypothetical protein
MLMSREDIDFVDFHHKKGKKDRKGYKNDRKERLVNANMSPSLE